MSNPSRGCDLCGDFPVHLRARCHPAAPLRVEIPHAGEIVFYCYLPDCNREVARMLIADDVWSLGLLTGLAVGFMAGFAIGQRSMLRELARQLEERRRS